MSEILTIGYEGAVQDAVLNRLAAAEIGLLIDVRAVPQSRKPGFSKRLLAGSMSARGIAYVHLRDLGTPKPGREAARRGDAAGMTRVFNEHMNTLAAKTALDQAVDLARANRCCLLCFEADHRLCHRSIVAGLICERTGQVVSHLRVA